MNRLRRPVLSILAALVASCIATSACGPLGASPPPTSASTASANPTQPFGPATATVLQSASGEPFELEGVLEVEGSLPRLHFFLFTEDGARIEVLPWLPVEAMHPPSGQPAPPTMADWVGQKVELRGSWVQSESGLVFQVTLAEREQP